jgi:hypothetical protein
MSSYGIFISQARQSGRSDAAHTKRRSDVLCLAQAALSGSAGEIWPMHDPAMIYLMLVRLSYTLLRGPNKTNSTCSYTSYEISALHAVHFEVPLYFTKSSLTLLAHSDCHRFSLFLVNTDGGRIAIFFAARTSLII